MSCGTRNYHRAALSHPPPPMRRQLERTFTAAEKVCFTCTLRVSIKPRSSPRRIDCSTAMGLVPSQAAKDAIDPEQEVGGSNLPDNPAPSSKPTKPCCFMVCRMEAALGWIAPVACPPPSTSLFKSLPSHSHFSKGTSLANQRQNHRLRAEDPARPHLFTRP